MNWYFVLVLVFCLVLAYSLQLSEAGFLILPASEIRIKWKHNREALFSPAEILVDATSYFESIHDR